MRDLERDTKPGEGEAKESPFSHYTVTQNKNTDGQIDKETAEVDRQRGTH